MVMKKLAAVLFALALLVMSVGAVAETSVVTCAVPRRSGSGYGCDSGRP